MKEIELKGFDDALKTLKRYLNPERNKIMKAAFNDAAKYLKMLAKLYARKQSGTLSRSIIIKLKVYKDRGIIVAMVGPKSWYMGQYKGQKRIAHKYAHLVEKGRKGFMQKAYILGRSTPIMRYVKRARPFPFVGRAARTGNNRAIEIIRVRIKTGMGW